MTSYSHWHFSPHLTILSLFILFILMLQEHDQYYWGFFQWMQSNVRTRSATTCSQNPVFSTANVQNWPDALLDCDLWNQWPFTSQVIALTTALGSNVRKFHKALEEPPVSLFPPKSQGECPNCTVMWIIQCGSRSIANIMSVWQTSFRIFHLFKK